MKKQNILIIASGAREHAIGWKLKQSSKVGKIYFAPGTAGTETIGKNTGITMLDNDALITFALQNKIDFTIATQDDILANGVVNAFQKKGLKIFGPTKEAAQIESSKVFSKQLMIEEGIPTATYETFSDFQKAKNYLKTQQFPLVIKADGLAFGKGVIIAKTLKEAEKTLVDIFTKKIFGASGNRVVIEEFLEGNEISIHALSDGEHVSLFPASRDHKTIFEENLGPNTGGMGTVTLSDITKEQLEEIKQTIVLPAINGLKKQGKPFVGCLFPGLMMTKHGPKVIEFNSRFGDPEMEIYMRLLETDLFDVLSSCVDGTLDKQKITWSNKSACCIALASAGYPESSHKDDVIYGLDKADKTKDIVVFHFATKKENEKIVTNGGRVLGVTATGKTLDEALDKAYAVIGKDGIHFDGMQYRRDIGRVTSVIASDEEAKQSFSTIKAIIFDMDGLIVDSEIIESQALELILKDNKKNPNPYPNGLIHIIGDSGDRHYQRFKDNYQLKNTIEDIREKKYILFEELIKETLTPLPGFLPLIISLKNRGFKIALASNRFIGHIHLIIDNLKVKHLFDVIVGPSKTRRHKPYPDIFLQTAKELSVAPNECLVLEDSEIGVAAAHAAGMKVIAVPNQYTKNHDFSKADHVVKSLEEIDERLLNTSENTSQQNISRIEIFTKVFDTRAAIRKKKIQQLNNIINVAIADIYTIDKSFTETDLQKIASSLSNPITQTPVVIPAKAGIQNKKISGSPIKSGMTFDWTLEIGFLPGVTDNIATTAKETITDLLKTEFINEENVYTSQVTFLEGKLSKKEALALAETLYNPLIQRMHIKSFAEYKKDGGMDVIVPKVNLQKEPQVIEVNLDVSDEELIKIGKAGVENPDGTRRGPLALDLICMKTIRDYFKKLKRNPTDIELESIAQTWSEHCKHTIFADPIDELKDGLYKTYIKKATQEIRKQKGAKDFCVSVFTDNSGGIVFDDKYLITHKVETHNSPSALDPFGGAITGIVGVNRDALGFGMGAKPVANFYGYCFADPRIDVPLYKGKNKTNKMLSSKRIMAGVIDGVNAGGNQSGIPTPQGFIYFDERYRGKPLVFVGTVGLIPRKIKGKLAHKKQAKPGDLIVMIGGRVGKDGIHGATFSSEALDSGSPATAVQIGDPITQKKLSDAIVKEARDLLLYNSITDNGAGGLSCSVAEMAKESGGCKVELERVPLKYSGLDPWEIWISESQERMTVAVTPEKWKQFSTLMKRRGVEATVIGEFTKNETCIVTYHGKTIMKMNMDFLHDGLPVRPMKSQPPQINSSVPTVRKPKNGTKTLTDMLKRLNIASYEFISQQYDHIVQGNAVLGPLQGKGRVNADTSVIRPVLTSKKGVIMSQGLYPSYSEVDPYRMSASAIDTAIRNAVAAGANPDYLSILDNFCWASSNDPQRLWQLKQAAKACFDYAVSYGTPFISGKDSMFNDFKGFDKNDLPIHIAIQPTLLITSFGVINDISKVVSLDAKQSGDLLYLLGDTNDELGGSEYCMFNKLTGGDVPQVDAEKNKKLYDDLYRAIQKNLIASSISISRGGLAIALAKKAIGGQLGITVDLKKLVGNTTRDDFVLYSESQGRILVSIAKENKAAFETMMKRNILSHIGKITKEPVLVIKGLQGKEIITMPITKATKAYRETFRDY